MTWRDTERELVAWFRAEGWGIGRVAITGDFITATRPPLAEDEDDDAEDAEDAEVEINLTLLARHLSSVNA